MQHQDPTVLATDLGADPSFVDVTIGLDKGRLLKSRTHVYFITQRMGGWEVVEQSLLSDVSRVSQSNNFMGKTMIVVTNSGRWTCKDITEGVDLRHWFGAEVSNVTPITKAVETVKRRLESTQSTTISPSTSSSNDLSQSQASTSPENTKPTSSTDSPQLDDIFSYVQSSIDSTSSTTSPHQKTTDNEMDTFLADIQSDNDEESTGMGRTIIKWVILIWIFSSFIDFC